jgi:hypothetical protein
MARQRVPHVLRGTSTAIMSQDDNDQNLVGNETVNLPWRPHVSPFEQSVETLLRASHAARERYPETNASAEVVVKLGARASTKQRNAALALLADPITSAEIPHGPLVAIACGALVEQGGDAHLVGQAILQRFTVLLGAAGVFVAACRAAAVAEGVGDDDADSIVERYTPRLGPEMPEHANAWGSLDIMCRPALAILQSSKTDRQSACVNVPLMDGIRALADVHDGASWILQLLDVLDDEPLLVLHPALRRGFRITISGIADNFQLHTLLAGALIGNPKKGWLPGKPPDPRVLAAARDRTVDARADSAIGSFNLVNWSGLAADGTVPEGSDTSGHWIWNEGTPRDILTFEGLRVVLLTPPPYVRSWNAGRRFPSLPGELQVREQLPADEVQDWLRRMASAQASI